MLDREHLECAVSFLKHLAPGPPTLALLGTEPKEVLSVRGPKSVWLFQGSSCWITYFLLWGYSGHS